MSEHVSARFALRSCSDPLGLHRFRKPTTTTVITPVVPSTGSINPPPVDWRAKATNPKSTEALRLTALDLLRQLIFRTFATTIPLADIHPLYAGSDRQFVFTTKPYAESRIGKPHSSRRPDDFRAWFAFELAALIRDLESGKVLVLMDSMSDDEDSEEDFQEDFASVSIVNDTATSSLQADNMFLRPSVEVRAHTEPSSTTLACSNQKAFTLCTKQRGPRRRFTCDEVWDLAMIKNVATIPEVLKIGQMV